MAEVEGEPLLFQVRDGFNSSVVVHIFRTTTPSERSVWVQTIANAIQNAQPLNMDVDNSAQTLGYGSIADSQQSLVSTSPRSEDLGEQSKSERTESLGTESLGAESRGSQSPGTEPSASESAGPELPDAHLSAVVADDGKSIELTMDEFEELKINLETSSAIPTMKSLRLSPDDRPYCVDSKGQRTWLHALVIGTHSANAPAGNGDHAHIVLGLR